MSQRRRRGMPAALAAGAGFLVPAALVYARAVRSDPAFDKSASARTRA